MKARSLLSGAAYGPERLKDIYRAFDEAWEAIKPVLADSPLAHESARLKLANLILAVAEPDKEAKGGEDGSAPSESSNHNTG